MQSKFIYSSKVYFMKSKFIYLIKIYYFQLKFTYEIYVQFLESKLIFRIYVNVFFFQFKFNFRESKLIFDIQIRLIKWKFVLSNQSLTYPSVTKKKIIVKGKRMFCFRCGITLVTEGSFCFGCGAKKRITLTGDNTLTEREVIGHYFHCGFDYKASVHFLKTHCDISLSERDDCKSTI